MNFLTKLLDRLRAKPANDPHDQRRYSRAVHECWANVRCVESDRQDLASRYSLGLSQDISHGGVRVQCFHQIPLKAEVYINLECPNNHQPIHANGAVVWASPAEHLPGHWVLGIAFSELDQPTRDKIKKLVDQALEQQPPDPEQDPDLEPQKAAERQE
jgi:Tfp pilus assembly protein PilZ